MGATAFERMRRVNAAREMVELLDGQDLEEFRLAFSLPCDPTPTGIQEALTSRTDYVELRHKIAAWVAAQEHPAPAKPK